MHCCGEGSFGSYLFTVVISVLRLHIITTCTSVHNYILRGFRIKMFLRWCDARLLYFNTICRNQNPTFVDIKRVSYVCVYQSSNFCL